MKATELRIGNWYNEFGIPKQATSEFIDRLFNIQNTGRIALDVSDIPLTEEWLLKTDLIKGVSFHNDILSGIITVSSYSYEDNWSLYFGSVHIRYFIYVHTLQNLFYALSGEELTIKN